MAKDSLMPQRQSNLNNTSMLGSNRGGAANYSRYMRSNPNGATQTVNRGGTGNSGYGDDVNISNGVSQLASTLSSFNPRSNLGSFYSMPAFQYSSPSRMMGTQFSDYLSQYMDNMGGLTPPWARADSSTMNKVKPEEKPVETKPTTYTGEAFLGNLNKKLARPLNEEEINQAANLLGGRRENLTDADQSTIMEAIKKHRPDLLGGI